MRLLIQPTSGLQPLLDAIHKAKTKIEIVIFRFDSSELEKALAAAVTRGVFVHALIAHVTGAGEQKLRALESRLLGVGVSVARSPQELIRYHYKMMIIDRKTLYVLSFNFTNVDITGKRSFGIVTTDARTVQEAVKLFEADVKKQPYEPGRSDLVVSPETARERLSQYIEGARRTLLIYDLRVSDGSILRLLEQRAKDGVEVRIIGGASNKRKNVAMRPMTGVRLHARCMVRDGRMVFVGSQSLRANELDARREAGIIVRDTQVARQISEIFEQDWKRAGDKEGEALTDPLKVAKKVAHAVAKQMPPVASVVTEMVQQITGSDQGLPLKPGEIESTVKQAVEEAVKMVVREAVEDSGDDVRA